MTSWGVQIVQIVPLNHEKLPCKAYANWHKTPYRYCNTTRNMIKVWSYINITKVLEKVRNEVPFYWTYLNSWKKKEKRNKPCPFKFAYHLQN